MCDGTKFLQSHPVSHAVIVQPTGAGQVSLELNGLCYAAQALSHSRLFCFWLFSGGTLALPTQNEPVKEAQVSQRLHLLEVAVQVLAISRSVISYPAVLQCKQFCSTMESVVRTIPYSILVRHSMRTPTSRGIRKGAHTTLAQRYAKSSRSAESSC